MTGKLGRSGRRAWLTPVEALLECREDILRDYAVARLSVEALCTRYHTSARQLGRFLAHVGAPVRPPLRRGFPKGRKRPVDGRERCRACGSLREFVERPGEEGWSDDLKLCGHCMRWRGWWPEVPRAWKQRGACKVVIA